jgi:hypothetical protein
MRAELHLAEALVAERRRQMGGPQPLRLDGFLERGVDAVELGLREAVLDGLDRQDLLADEGPHPFELALELGISGEVPAHPVPFSRSWAEYRTPEVKSGGCFSARR